MSEKKKNPKGLPSDTDDAQRVVSDELLERLKRKNPGAMFDYVDPIHAAALLLSDELDRRSVR